MNREIFSNNYRRLYNTVYRTCPFTGEHKMMVIYFDPADYEAWENGELIQNAFPYLTADEREFIKTGITPDVFPGEE